MADSPSPEQLAAVLNHRRGGFNELIGLRFCSATLDEVIAEVELRPEHGQPYGIVHGGVYASIVETVCSAGAALHFMASGHSVVGLDNHTSFLRAARQGTLTATARPLKTGRRSHVWRADVEDADGRVLAAGQLRMLILEPGAALAGAVLRSGEGPQ